MKRNSRSRGAWVTAFGHRTDFSKLEQIALDRNGKYQIRRLPVGSKLPINHNPRIHGGAIDETILLFLANVSYNAGQNKTTFAFANVGMKLKDGTCRF
jgi:hypothetical protein